MNIDKIKGYFKSKLDEINQDYNYSPLSRSDIVDLIYDKGIVAKIDTSSNEYIKYKDCEFFASNDLSNNTPSIFDVINKCYSITGSKILMYECSNVSNNIDLLRDKQNVIIGIRDKVSRLTTLVEKFGKIENSIYWHLKDKTQEFRDVCDTLYFKSKWLSSINENERILSIYYFFLIIWTPLWGLFGPVLFFFVPYLFSNYVLKLKIPFSFYWGQLKQMLFGSQLFTILKVVKEGFKVMKGGGNGNMSIKNKIIDTVFNIIVSPLGRWVYFAILVVSYVWSITNNFISALNTHKFSSYIHNRIHDVWSLFTLVKEVESISGIKCNVSSNVFISEILACKNISSESKLLTTKGECLTMYWKIYNNKRGELDVIGKCLKYLGMIDKLVCVSRLVNDCDFNFVEYLTDSDLPRLECYEMFNPVFSKSCIKNDLCLFNDNLDIKDKQNWNFDKQNCNFDKQNWNFDKQNCILTGPNGSGKSSLLKTTLINIILGQTLGIVPSKKLIITPFKYISSYLNIADAQGKESLFQAEMSRCHNHLEKLKELETEKDGFSFNIMDEIFVSTNYFEGVSGAYAIIKNLEKYKKSMNIITTHFDILTQNEYRQPSYCFKYFTMDDNGNKDYLIRNGVNDKHCALTLLKEKGFDEDLCIDANNFYLQIKNNNNKNNLDALNNLDNLNNLDEENKEEIQTIDNNDENNNSKNKENKDKENNIDTLDNLDELNDLDKLNKEEIQKIEHNKKSKKTNKKLKSKKN